MGLVAEEEPDFTTMVKKSAIDAQIELASKVGEDSEGYTYALGVLAGLSWVAGELNELPLDPTVPIQMEDNHV